jgi:hypothetical protein
MVSVIVTPAGSALLADAITGISSTWNVFSERLRNKCRDSTLRTYT